MERWCLGRAKSSGRTRVVILNPSCVYGVQGKTYTRMPAELAEQGRFCWINEGQGIANHVYVENLVDAILLAAARPEAHGRRFIINDGCRTWREFLTPLLGEYAEGLPSYTAEQLRALNRRPPKRLRDLVRAAARSPEVVATVNEMRWLGPLKRFLLRRAPAVRDSLRRKADPGGTGPSASPVPPDWLADLFAPTRSQFTARLAEQVLGWRPRVGLEEAMRSTAAWLREMGIAP
jgi:nucleoside-diphosphate-sugar epimerase